MTSYQPAQLQRTSAERIERRKSWIERTSSRSGRHAPWSDVGVGRSGNRKDPCGNVSDRESDSQRHRARANFGGHIHQQSRWRDAGASQRTDRKAQRKNRSPGGQRRIAKKTTKPPQPVISTFHAQCVQILRRHAKALGFPAKFSIYDRGDQESLGPGNSPRTAFTRHSTASW